MEALLLAALIAPAVTAAADLRTPPAPHCLDARRVERAQVLDAQRMLVAEAGGRRFRLHLAEACPNLGIESSPSLLGREGWICGEGGEFLRAGDWLCPVREVENIDARSYAQLQREADLARVRSAEGETPTLERVDVITRSDARRGFRGSYDYCFDPRAVRGWSLGPEGLRLQTSARRSGGFRNYTVELGASCPELQWATSVSFVSGVGIGVICGNTGDRAVSHGEAAAPGLRDGEAFATRTPHLAALRGCPIRAVYPE